MQPQDATTLVSSPSAKRARVGRRWLRYSMRTLLVAVTLACVWLGTVVNRAQQQRRAVEVLRKAGNHVFYDTSPNAPGGQRANWRWLRSWLGDDYFDNATSAILQSEVNDGNLRLLVDLRGLKQLHVMSYQVTDEGLASIARLPDLEILAVHAPNATDDGIRTLAELPKLRDLWLNAPHVTDRGVKALSRSASLKALRLADAKLTNEGLESLTALSNLECLSIESPNHRDSESIYLDDESIPYVLRLANLEELRIENSSISDSGLAQLAALKNLRQLHIQCPHPSYTLAGIEALQEKLPGLSVTHSAWNPTWHPSNAAYPVFTSGPRRRN